jgi:hypothetical protein
MPDEPKPEDKVSGTDNEPQKVELSEAEHQALVDKAAFTDKLQAQADDYGFDSAQQFVDAGELAMLDAEKAQTDTDDKPKDDGKKDEPAKKEEPSPAPKDDGKIDALRQHTADAVLTSQQALYVFKHPKSDLDIVEAKKAIMSKKDGPLIAHIASTKTDGNFFEAYDYIKRLEKGESGLRKEGADAAEALKNAEDTADTTTGTTMKDTDTDARTDMQKEADKIAPDDTYVYDG